MSAALKSFSFLNVINKSLIISLWSVPLNISMHNFPYGSSIKFLLKDKPLTVLPKEKGTITLVKGIKRSFDIGEIKPCDSFLFRLHNDKDFFI